MLSRLATAFMAAGAAVAILAFGLVAVTRAADGAVPGHPLYGLDRALEQVEARLTRDPASLAELRLRLAEERLGEVAELARANDQAHLQEGLEGYGDAIVALSQTPGAGPGTGGGESVSQLDRVLASHEEQLEAALEDAGGVGGEETAEVRWCAGQGTHPLADGLAQCYEIEADTVIHWFCDEGHSFGEIVHALQTGEVVGGTAGLDETADALLDLKAQLGGWGQVWEKRGLFGAPDKPALPTPTSTPEPPGRTSTPQPPAEGGAGSSVPTPTPQLPGQTSTPQLPAQGHNLDSSGPTSTPESPGPTSTPEPPG